jgi:hypothetical protein
MGLIENGDIKDKIKEKYINKEKRKKQKKKKGILNAHILKTYLIEES